MRLSRIRDHAMQVREFESFLFSRPQLSESAAITVPIPRHTLNFAS